MICKKQTFISSAKANENDDSLFFSPCLGTKDPGHPGYEAQNLEDSWRDELRRTTRTLLPVY